MVIAIVYSKANTVFDYFTVYSITVLFYDLCFFVGLSFQRRFGKRKYCLGIAPCRSMIYEFIVNAGTAIVSMIEKQIVSNDESSQK